MKRTPLFFVLFVLFLMMTQTSFAQVGINPTGANPHPSAMLDIVSADKGLLIPRLTSAQRAGIAGPATGLMVFDSDTGTFWFYTGSAWQEITLNSDDQTLSLSGTTLEIEDGNSIDLAVIDTDTDDQTLSLSGTTLTIEDGNAVDLSPLVDDNDWVVSGSNLYNANSGNVGIGTTTPSHALEIASGNLEISSSSDAPAIYLTDDADNSNWLIRHQRSNDRLEFIRNNSEYNMILHNNGNLGVGDFVTQSPTVPSERLSVKGRVRIMDGNEQDGYVLASDANGVGTWTDPATVFTDTDTDDQTLSLSGTTLTIEDGNAVDLAGIDTDTDDQTLSLSGTTLTIEDGNAVDLSSIDTDTDDQTLSFVGTTLSIEDGNTVNLSSLDTDDQTLSLSGTDLTIAEGNTIDLSSIDTDTDDQTLSLSGTDLTISEGNTIDLSSIDTDTDTDDQTLTLSGTTLTIEDGNAVDLAGIDTDTDDQTLSLSGSNLTISEGNTVDLSSLGSGVAALIQDSDQNTKIQVEETANDDIIRFDVAGTEQWRMEESRLEPGNAGNSVFIGLDAGAADDLTNNQTIYIGNFAGQNHTNGLGNTVIGYQSFSLGSAGTYNTILGNSTMVVSQGDDNVAIGSAAMISNFTGDFNTVLGTRAGYNNTGSSNVFLGYQAGHNNGGGSGNVFLGPNAGYNEAGSNRLYIDNSDTPTPLIYGDFSTDLIRINGILNINNAYNLPTVSGASGQVLVTDGAGQANWEDPNVAFEDTDDQTLSLSGSDLTISDGNTVDLSTLPIAELEDADQNTRIQVEESANDDVIRFDVAGTEQWRMEEDRLENSGSNLLIGNDAGGGNTSGTSNVAVGENALNSNLNIIGNDNIAIGNNALNTVQAIGSRNIMIGSNPNTGGIGSDNIWIGNNLSPASLTGHNRFVVDNNGGVPLMQGDFISNQLSVGGSLAVAGDLTVGGAFNFPSTLSVNTLTVGSVPNQYTLPTSDGSNNQVLVTDGSGNLSWVNSNVPTQGLIHTTVTANVQNINSNNKEYFDFTVSGAQTGSSVTVSPSAPLPGRIIIAYAFVVSANTVRVFFINESSSAENPPEMDYYITVIK